ncbi:MAG TPA: MFS transporter [Microthrixaceae bacterium]|nr:MFS transporter [Microthrixaceae bacterium]
MTTELRPDRAPAPSNELPVADLIGRGLIARCFGIGTPTLSVVADPPHVSGLTPREIKARWRAFRAFWAGHLCSTIGDHMRLVALPIAADRLTGSAVVVALIVSAEALATVLFGTMAGSVTDRRHPRPVMIRTNVARAAILALVALLGWSELGPAALLVIAAFALSLLRLFHDGAESSLIARLVPDELDVRTDDRLNLSENIGVTVGPLLAGAAISLGVWLAFGVDAIIFVIAAIAVAVVGRLARRRHIELAPAPDEETREPLRREFAATFKEIRANRVYRRSLVVMAFASVAALPLGPQFVSLATDDLGLSPWAIGAMFAIGGLSGIVAAPFIERRDDIRPGVIMAGTALFSGAVLLTGLVPSILTAALAFAAVGVGVTAAMTHLAAMRQRVYPNHQQGRIALTSRMVVWSVLPVAAIVGGVLSDVLGPTSMWIVCGGIGLAAAAWAVVVGLAREPVTAPPLAVS